MTKIRVYHIPNGYTDVICDGVTVVPNKNQCIVRGGPDDGKIFENSSGAQVIKYDVGIQGSLF